MTDYQAPTPPSAGSTIPPQPPLPPRLSRARAKLALQRTRQHSPTHRCSPQQPTLTLLLEKHSSGQHKNARIFICVCGGGLDCMENGPLNSLSPSAINLLSLPASLSFSHPPPFFLFFYPPLCLFFPKSSRDIPNGNYS